MTKISKDVESNMKAIASTYFLCTISFWALWLTIGVISLVFTNKWAFIISLVEHFASFIFGTITIIFAYELKLITVKWQGKGFSEGEDNG